MSIIRVEVRCCCDAGKLLGTCLVPELAMVNTHIRFMGELGQSAAPLDLKVVVVCMGGRRYLALKSMDKPIEQLRTLPGWKEA